MGSWLEKGIHLGTVTACFVLPTSFPHLCQKFSTVLVSFNVKGTIKLDKNCLLFELTPFLSTACLDTDFYPLCHALHGIRWLFFNSIWWLFRRGINCLLRGCFTWCDQADCSLLQEPWCSVCFLSEGRFTLLLKKEQLWNLVTGWWGKAPKSSWWAAQAVMEVPLLFLQQQCSQPSGGWALSSKLFPISEELSKVTAGQELTVLLCASLINSALQFQELSSKHLSPPLKISA